MERNNMHSINEISVKRNRKKRLQKVLTVLSAIVVFCTTYALILPAITMEDTVYCGYESKHSDSCYEEVQKLICGLEETQGHVHTDDCYRTESTLVCKITDAEHVHGDDCYATENILICGKEECEVHQHTKSCYETEKKLICEKPLHEHTLQCFSNPDADVEDESVWERLTSMELSGDAGSDTLAVANTQIGYSESDKNYHVLEDGKTKNGYTRFGDKYGDKYADWSVQFCRFCLDYANVSAKQFPRGEDRDSWIEALKDAELYKDADYMPVEGDIAFLRNGNCAIVSTINNEKITVIEGNSEDQVKENTYDVEEGQISGYGVVTPKKSALKAMLEQPAYASETEGEEASKAENAEEPTAEPTAKPTEAPTEEPTAAPQVNSAAAPAVQEEVTEEQPVVQDEPVGDDPVADQPSEDENTENPTAEESEKTEEAGNIEAEPAETDPTAEDTTVMPTADVEKEENVPAAAVEEVEETGEEPDPDEDQAEKDTDKKPESFVIAEKRSDIKWKGVEYTSAEGMLIPRLFQGDYRTTVCYVDGRAKSVATSGCGATSLSMVIAYLTDNYDQNPYILFREAVENDRYHGCGLSHETLTWLAKNYGVRGEWIENDAQQILDALNSGKPVIAHMGEGIFTNNGHYIVLRGVTADGKILVNDPASSKRCKMAFPLSTIINQARVSDAFMVCAAIDAPEKEAEETVEKEEYKVEENTAWVEKTRVTLEDKTGNLNIRAKADAESTWLECLRDGDEVFLLKAGDDWSLINTENDITGYVLSANLVATGEKPDTAVVELNDKDSHLSLREEPDTESDYLGDLNHGDRVCVISMGDEWAKVVTEDLTVAYVHSQYLRTETVESDSEPEKDEEEEKTEYFCGLEEHKHSESCYTDGELTCGLVEHTHDETCLVMGEEDQDPEDAELEEELVLEEKTDEIGWKGYIYSGDAGMPIPRLFQGDYPTVVCTINGQPRSVATSGCGATSVSMVIAYLTGNRNQNPYTLFYDAVADGYYYGSGLSHNALSQIAAKYGVNSRWIANNGDAIIDALKSGKPVIAHMGKGIFTSRGHYIVLRGVTEDGMILVNDPASRTNSDKAFPIETLLAQARTNASFMVCWTGNLPTIEAAEGEKVVISADKVGFEVILTAEYEGEENYQWQWQVSDDGENWMDISGAMGAEYRFAATEEQYDLFYRVWGSLEQQIEVATPKLKLAAKSAPLMAPKPKKPKTEETATSAPEETAIAAETTTEAEQEIHSDKIRLGDVLNYSESILVVAGSDFQDSAIGSGTGSYNNQINLLTDIMYNIYVEYHEDYGDAYGFLGGGDFGLNDGKNANNTRTGITQVTNAVKGVFDNCENIVFVQGNHDGVAGVNGTGTGAHDTDFYGVYVINEDDYPAGGGTAANVKAVADNLDKYLAGRVSENDDKPVFVITHVPLHYSSRTKSSGDAKYACYLFDTLSKYGDQLNIIFIHGHNHSGDDDPFGGACIFLTDGDELLVAKEGSTSEYESRELNFTYMNYGYTGFYYSKYGDTSKKSGVDDTLTMTSFLIDGDDVIVRRWDEDGEHEVLKSVGAARSWVTEAVPVNNVCYTSPQLVEGPVESSAPEGDPSVSEGAAIEAYEGDLWTKCVSEDDIAAGETYLIVSGGHALGLGSDQGLAAAGASAVSAKDIASAGGKTYAIAGGDGTAKSFLWQLEGSKDAWKLRNLGADDSYLRVTTYYAPKYIYGADKVEEIAITLQDDGSWLIHRDSNNNYGKYSVCCVNGAFAVAADDATNSALTLYKKASVPACDCGSTKTDLFAHDGDCPRREFAASLCELSAADLYSVWQLLPSDVRHSVLDSLEANDTVKYVALLSLLGEDPFGETLKCKVGNETFTFAGSFAEGMTPQVEAIDANGLALLDEYIENYIDAKPTYGQRIVSEAFDISVLDGDEKAVFDAPVTVTVGGFDLGNFYRPDLDVTVYHFVDTEAEDLANLDELNPRLQRVSSRIDENGNIVFETDGFSVFYFTVDFHYKERDFSIEGNGSVLLSEIFEQFDLDFDASEIVNVDFTDETLVSVASVNDGADWQLTSLAPFTSTEALTVSFKNGTVLEIMVTDAQVTWTKITSLKSGDVVRVESTRSTGKYLTTTVNNNNRLTLSNADSAVEWTVENSNGTLRLKNGNNYLTLGNGTANVTTTVGNAATLTLVSGQTYWQIALNGYYLNDYGGNGTQAGGYNQNATNDQGSRWNLYLKSEEGGDAPTKYYWQKLTTFDTSDYESQYLIINHSGTDKYALTYGGTGNAAAVTLTQDGKYYTTPVLDDASLWTYNSNNNLVNVGDTSRYLYMGQSSFISTNTRTITVSGDSNGNFNLRRGTSDNYWVGISGTSYSRVTSNPTYNLEIYKLVDVEPTYWQKVSTITDTSKNYIIVNRGYALTYGGSGNTAPATAITLTESELASGVYETLDVTDAMKFTFSGNVTTGTNVIVRPATESNVYVNLGTNFYGSGSTSATVTPSNGSFTFTHNSNYMTHTNNSTSFGISGTTAADRNMEIYMMVDAPHEEPANPSDGTTTIVPRPPIHNKTIDAFRDGVDNGDTSLDNDPTRDLTDLYRLYLDIGPETIYKPVDVLFVLDRSYSMQYYTDATDLLGNTGVQRRYALNNMINGQIEGEEDNTSVLHDNGLIALIRALNPDNKIAVVNFNHNADDFPSDGWKVGEDIGVIKRDTAQGTNYTDALWEAEDALEFVKDDGQKKLIFFLSDGDPTEYSYIDPDTGEKVTTTTSGAETSADCAEATTQAIADFQTWVQANLDDYDIYTVGIGKQGFTTTYLSEISPNHEPIWSSDFQIIKNALDAAITQNYGHYTDLKITDTLSDYVDFLPTDEEVDLVVQRLWKDSKTIDVYPQDLYRDGELYDYGKNFIKSVELDRENKSVTVDFADGYQEEGNYIYRVSFNVKTEPSAYEAYEESGYPTYGDAKTDFTDNYTSSRYPGFFSNSEAKLYYRQVIGDLSTELQSADYQRPVIQADDEEEPPVPIDTELGLDNIKTIDFLGDGTTNADTSISGEALNDLYRLYLTAGPVVNVTPIDLLIILDKSGSMSENRDVKESETSSTMITRQTAVQRIMNGYGTEESFIKQFRELNPYNKIAVVAFSGFSNTSGSTQASSSPTYNWNYSTDVSVLLDWDDTGNTVTVPASGGTNYCSGLQYAHTFLEDPAVKQDNAIKVVLFVSDGRPTWANEISAITDTTGTRYGTGNENVVSSYPQIKTETEKVIDMFKAAHPLPNTQIFTIGLGSAFGNPENPTAADLEKIAFMERLNNNADDVPTQVFTQQDKLLEQFKKIMLGNNTKLMNVTIKDHLSEYVDLYELPEYKVTATKNGVTTVLYENGQFLNGGNTVLNGAPTYNPTNKTVTLRFRPNIDIDLNTRYELSFNVNPSELAYELFRENIGKGISGYEGVQGDPATDYGTNKTSSAMPGFHSNTEAYVTYELGGDEYTDTYRHPVVQVYSPPTSPDDVNNVKAVKIWTDPEDKTVDHSEDSVTVVLKQDNVVVEDSEQVLNEENEWTYTYTDLEPDHSYTVEEVPIPEHYMPNYSATITESTTEGWENITVTNAASLSVGELYRFTRKVGDNTYALTSVNNSSSLVVEARDDDDEYQQWTVTTLNTGDNPTVVLQNVGSGRYLRSNTTSGFDTVTNSNSATAFRMTNSGQIRYRYSGYTSYYLTMSDTAVGSTTTASNGTAFTVDHWGEVPLKTYEITIDNQRLPGYDLEVSKVWNCPQNLRGPSVTLALYEEVPDSGESMLRLTPSLDDEENEIRVQLSPTTEWKGTIEDLDPDTNYYLRELDTDGYFVSYSGGTLTTAFIGDETVKVVRVDSESPTITVTNATGTNLPHTGGVGTDIFHALGALLMAGALMYGYAARRRRERRSE